MHLPVSADTPFHRASIKDIPIEELDSMMEALRVRRFAAYTIYEAGLQAKQRAKDEKAAMSLGKTCDQVQKLFIKLDSDMEKLEKKVLDIQAWRLILGDDINAASTNSGT